MHRKDLVQELITAIAPVIIKKTLQRVSAQVHTAPTDDELEREIAEECQVTKVRACECGVCEDCISSYIGPYGDLMVDICMILDEMFTDLKSQLKQELAMTMHMELELMKAELMKTERATVKKDSTDNNTDDMLIEIDSTAQLAEVQSGYSAIKKYESTSPAMVPTLAPLHTVPTPTTHTPAMPTPAMPTVPTVPTNALQDNPLFQAVSKSVDRAKAGLSTHSAEDYNTLRANRTNDDTNAAILLAEARRNADTEPSDISTNDDMWDQMLRDRLGM